jgi:uncharacterized protein (TIGR03382 family)
VLALLVTLSFAQAATFDVCATCPYTTIGDAARAASASRSSRSTIRIAAGEYLETDTITVYGSVTIVGDGSDVTIVRSTADPVLQLGYHVDDAGLVAKVSVSGLALLGSAGDGIRIVRSDATITDLRAENLPGEAVNAWRGPLTVEGSTFAGNETAIVLDSNVGGYDLTVADSSFSGHTSSAILATWGPIEVTNSTFLENRAAHGAGIYAIDAAVLTGNRFVENRATGYGGAVYFGSVGAASLTGNRFCRNEAEFGGAVHSPGGFEGSGNLFVENIATVAGGDISLGTGASLLNNTFVGSYAPQGGSVYSDYGWVDFRNNVVAHTSEYSLYGTRGTPVIAYNDFWDVAPDAVGGTWPAADSTNLAVDPMFVSYVEGGCEELDLGLLPESPLWDAGDPTTYDPDGTVRDMGATSGATRWYRDADGDGYGSSQDFVCAPTRPAGYAAEPGDCDDSDPDRYPSNAESCDGLDQDCDDEVDESATDMRIWREDADGDGFQGATRIRSCEPPPGWAADSGEADCDDADASVYPGAVELCGDGIDQDCDDEVDEAQTWRPDTDGDGFQALESVEECAAPEGWSADEGPPYDCDDDDASIFPGATELPGDGRDHNCDGRDSLVTSEGCKGCDSGTTPTWVLVALGVAAVGSRRKTVLRNHRRELVRAPHDGFSW